MCFCYLIMCNLSSAWQEKQSQRGQAWLVFKAFNHILRPSIKEGEPHFRGDGLFVVV